MTEDEIAILEDVASFHSDPESHALYVYPWGEGELTGFSGPRQWQRDVMRDIKEHLENPETRFMPLQLAVASGHGIGKSALISMLSKWAMDTCNDCKIVITANTESQLRTKTWAEVGKWFRLALNADWFRVNGMGIASTEPGHEKIWRADAVTWSENNTESFAGLHNQGNRILVIMDEASNIADKVWEVTEGALTDENTEIIWIAFGNPTRASGRFRDCFYKYRHRWKCKQIDSRTVEGTNKAQIQKWVDDHGEDSDFVKVRVKGQFPSLSAKQFISTADVDAARGKNLRKDQYDFAPVILSCDPAWEGDDALVIAMRQGLHFKILETIPKNDNDIFIANKIARYQDELKADAVFIDGGYGTGIISAGRTMGRHWQIVWFNGASNDPGCINKRAEMWNEIKRWLKEGGSIPDDQELYDDLIAVETIPKIEGIIQLESKKDMKARGLPSPNKGDALALTFAFPVTKNTHTHHNLSRTRRDYNPLA